MYETIGILAPEGTTPQQAYDLAMKEKRCVRVRFSGTDADWRSQVRDAGDCAAVRCENEPNTILILWD